MYHLRDTGDQVFPCGTQTPSSTSTFTSSSSCRFSGVSGDEVGWDDDCLEVAEGGGQMQIKQDQYHDI